MVNIGVMASSQQMSPFWGAACSKRLVGTSLHPTSRVKLEICQSNCVFEILPGNIGSHLPSAQGFVESDALSAAQEIYFAPMPVDNKAFASLYMGQEFVVRAIFD